LHEQAVVTFATLQESLGVSRATLKRDLEYLRTRLQAPIVWDRELGGYRFDAKTAAAEGRYGLPGLWFSAAEIHALLTMHHLLDNLDEGGLLTPHVKPLMARLSALLSASQHTAAEIQKRVRIVGSAKRPVTVVHFETVGSALLNRRRLRLTYRARGNGETSERDVSPQRLVHYRDNWYLDAWCHLRNALRHFSVDAIERAEILPAAAYEVPADVLERRLESGYGIFSGADVAWAEVRFTPARARWVASETWHPQQAGWFDESGRYVLRIPFTDTRELTMDILKYGPDCEVLKPESLRAEVAQALSAALQNYR
jgi:predicted DNA-binding transcriptional regulator YafY